MLRYFLVATAIVLGSILVFIAFPIRTPRPLVPESASRPGPRATLPIPPHSTGGRLVGEASWAFDALPSCFVPRWEWAPGSDRVEERVMRNAVEAQASGHVRASVVLDVWSGVPLHDGAAAAARHDQRLRPLPVDTTLHTGNCTLSVEAGRVHIVRGADDLTIAGARLYTIGAVNETLLVAAHDGPHIAEIGGYLLRAGP